MHTRFLLLPFAACAASVALSGSTIGYFQTNLVSDGAVPATVIDPDLKNPWGISFSPTTPFWVSDNGTGLSTLYAGDGAKLGLVVTIPPAPGSPVGTLGTPTGTVFNSSPGNFFGDRFLFATEAGTIAGWQPALGTTAAVRVDNSGSGAVYKGLAIAGGNIYATDFAGNKIDVWTNGYTSPSLAAGAFTDPNLPDGFAPFGIQNIGGSLYVTYARKQPGGDDDVAGPGFGIVDKYDTNGTLVQRVINPGGALNSPWGLALAPVGFGDLSGLLLVGNFGDGTINGFDPTTGMFVSSLNDHGGSPIVIDGLWGLAFGNAGPGFDQHKLYFTAGLNNEENGLFGSLAPVPEPGTMLLIGLSFWGLLLLRRKKFGPVRQLAITPNERAA